MTPREAASVEKETVEEWKVLRLHNDIQREDLASA